VEEGIINSYKNKNILSLHDVHEDNACNNEARHAVPLQVFLNSNRHCTFVFKDDKRVAAMYFLTSRHDKPV
jgi:hypothetical protein